MKIFGFIVLLFTIKFVCLNALITSSNQVCSSDWTNTDGICYEVFENEGNTNWDSAQTMCMSLGGYLAEIPNYFVQTTITDGLNEECWIGLRRNGTNFQWRSGRELDEFQFWKNREPGNTDCVSISDEMSEWITKGCGDMISCYICMNGSIYPPPLPTPQIGCDDGVVIEGRCYQVMDGRFSWERAQWKCELLGSNLVEISNASLYTQVNNLLHNHAYWIGLRLNTTSGKYEWRSGRELNDTNITWKNTNPSSNNQDNLDCAVVFKDGDWDLMSCNTKWHYICQSEITQIPVIQTIPVTEFESKTTTTPTIPTTTTTTTTTVISTPTTTTVISIPSIPTTVKGERDMLNETDCSFSKEGISSDITPCESIEEVRGQILEIRKDIYDDDKLNPLLSADINIGDYFISKINETTIIVAKIEQNSDANLTITDKVSIGIRNNSFSGDSATTIAAIVIESDPNQMTRSETGQRIEIVSDVCIVVSDKEVSGAVEIEFGINKKDGNTISCYFFNTTINAWSMNGIMTRQLTTDKIRCITDHFTSFALLVTFKTSEALDEETTVIQAYISTALCTVSLLFLVGSLVLYACVGKKFLSRDLNIIHLNYVIALILALLAFIAYSVIFFAEVQLEANNGICKAIAFFNHYFWLSVFSWNFCEAFHIVLALYSHRIPYKRHYIWLLAIGWGFPVPIVGITLGVAFNNYTNIDQEICFLNIDGGVIWAFLAPAYLIILVNTCILIFVIAMMVYVQRKRSFKKYLCSLIIGTATTLPLLGLPWIAGLLPNLAGLLRNNSISWLSYIFIVFNASQGIVFFLIHVIRNDQVLAKLFNRSMVEFTEELRNKNSQELLKIKNEEMNNSSKVTVEPVDLMDRTENGNQMTNEYQSIYTERIADIPCTIPIENPTYERSFEIKLKK